MGRGQCIVKLPLWRALGVVKHSTELAHLGGGELGY